MALKLANNATSRLAGAITDAQTTLSVTPGTGALFPALAGGDWHPLTVLKADGTFEIMRVTARSTDTLTVTRGQEGTTAIAFSANDRVELRLTKAAIDYLWSPDNDGAGSGLDADLLRGMAPATANTPSTVVQRDASGNFAAGTITASLSGNVTGDVTGNAGTATALKTSRTISLTGDVTGSASFNGTANAAISATVGDNSHAHDKTTVSSAVLADKLSASDNGSAPHYACRAWVNFNGTGTVAIRGSGNVSSITDNGVGDYTVNFATAMPDVNFGTNVTSNSNTNGNQVVMAALWPYSGTGDPQTTSSVRVLALPTGTHAGGQIDLHHMNVSVFR